MSEIVIDEKIRHGKPTIKGTRITVDEVLDMLKSGMSYEEITKDYSLTKDQIVAVLTYVSSLIHGEEVHKVPMANEVVS
ncbi:MAG: DUF433 domain-containing protein [Candidatus Micrarchaeota archaeon]